MGVNKEHDNLLVNKPSYFFFLVSINYSYTFCFVWVQGEMGPRIYYLTIIITNYL